MDGYIGCGVAVENIRGRFSLVRSLMLGEKLQGWHTSAQMHNSEAIGSHPWSAAAAMIR